MGMIDLVDGLPGIAFGRLTVSIKGNEPLPVDADGRWVFEVTPETDAVYVKILDDGQILLDDHLIPIRDGIASVVLSKLPVVESSPTSPARMETPSVISTEAWELLVKVGTYVIEHNLVEPVLFEQVIKSIYELAYFDQLADGVLNGLPDAPAVFIEFIAKEWVWNWATIPIRNPIEFDLCSLRLTRGVGPLLAAHFVGAEGRGPLGLATSAYLRRAEPIYRTLRAAEAFTVGTMSLEAVATTMSNAAKLLSPDFVGMPLTQLLSHDPFFDASRSSSPLSKFPGGNFQPPIPFPTPVPIPERPGLGAILDPCNWEWLNCADAFQRTPKLPQIQLPPPGPVTVEPSAICESDAAGTFQLTLTGMVGAAGRGWGVTLGAIGGQIISWTPREVVAEFKGPMLPGCLALTWVPDNGEFFDPLAACGAFFGPSPWKVPVARAGQMTIVGRPSIDYFTIGGQQGTTVSLEGNSSMQIEWKIRLELCDPSFATVTLLRDGIPWRTNLPLNGRISETTPCNNSLFQLEVTSGDGKQVCSIIQSNTILVNVFQTLNLVAPASIPAGGTASAVIRLSCPAPTDGVVVSFVSNPAGAITAPPVTIPSGDLEAPVMLQAQNACAAVQLTASAPDHVSSTKSLRVLSNPSIMQVTGISGNFQACKPIRNIRLTVGCISANVRVFVVEEGGMRTAIDTRRIPTQNANEFGGPFTLEVQVSDGLPSGTYHFEIEDEGRTTISTQTFIITSSPRIISIPSSVQAVAACPALTAELRVTVRGADKVTASYLGMTFTDRRPSANSECSNWSAVFRIPLSRVGSITVVPSLGMLDGMPTTVAAKLLFPADVRNAIVLRGNDSSGQQRSASVSTVILGPNGSTPSNAGTLAHGEVRTFPLADCTFMRVEGERDEVKDSNGVVVATRVVFNTSDFLGHPDAPPTEVMDI